MDSIHCGVVHILYILVKLTEKRQKSKVMSSQYESQIQHKIKDKENDQNIPVVGGTLTDHHTMYVRGKPHKAIHIQCKNVVYLSTVI